MYGLRVQGFGDLVRACTFQCFFSTCMAEAAQGTTVPGMISQVSEYSCVSGLRLWGLPVSELIYSLLVITTELVGRA